LGKKDYLKITCNSDSGKNRKDLKDLKEMHLWKRISHLRGLHGRPLAHSGGLLEFLEPLRSSWFAFDPTV